MSGDSAVLVNSSAWVGYFKPRSWGKLKAAVEEALVAGRVYTCWVVKAELLVGARDEGSFEKLLDRLRALPDIPIDDEIWGKASRLGFTLRKAGLTVPLPDLLVAQAALAGGLEVWHIDEHFDLISRATTLRARAFRE